MNCPICNYPMLAVDRVATINADGRSWVYKYRIMRCNDHTQQTWQTPEQFQDNLDAINAAKAAAGKLKKATS